MSNFAFAPLRLFLIVGALVGMACSVLLFEGHDNLGGVLTAVVSSLLLLPAVALDNRDE